MSYIEPITGGYVHIDVDGRTYRTAFEVAGSGIPVVCLHTASADSRQYRHLLNDSEITDRFRVIAFDMPWHGKSLPPDGLWDSEYALTRRFYIDFIARFCSALGLDRPALLGCSMGGYIMLDIALESPGAYRALIAVQPRAYAPSWTALNPLLDNPNVNLHHTLRAIVRSFSSPLAPPDRRREAEWIYSQAGPGVLAGDFHYGAGDHDVRDRMHEIDARSAGLYVIGGDWDLSCLPEHTDELARAIKALPVTRIPDAGHFPPSENPESFRKALLPILDEIELRP
jgi:pimeloyl-ACP methyl ester carboxylesterase